MQISKFNRIIDLVGVIGGTSVDSNLGVNFLKKNNVNAIGLNISDNPFDQTISQLCPKALTSKVEDKIKELIVHGCKSIFIYCNSLSSAIDLQYLRRYFNIPLITPIETYTHISNTYNSMAVMAANCQSLGNIEKIILKENPRAILTGFCSLLIVEAVEKGLSPFDIIEQFNLISLAKILEKNHIRLILLGCTHFSYFYYELKSVLKEEKLSIKVFDPSNTMYKNLYI